MSYEFRCAVDYSYGTLSAGATTLDTTLNSELFSDLPSDLSFEKYLPITLAEDSARRWEVVWVVGHGPGSTAIQVVRGREGTIAGTWPTGSSWRCAPTARDGTISSGINTIGPQYPDPHLGMRAVLIDVPKLVEYTDTGWQDAAPHAPGRMHGWQELVGTLASGVYTKVTGMTAFGPNAIATYGTAAGPTKGTVTLNRPGVWSFAWMVQSNVYANNTTLECRVEWPGGHPGLNGAQSGRISQSGYPGAFPQSLCINWVGYADEDMVTIPISFFCKQYNAAGATLTDLQNYVVMYYLGN